jgi:hypothetical protein
MTTIKTIGSSGADFSTINLAVSWVQANLVSSGVLTDSIVFDVLAVGVSPGASDTISGWTSAGGIYTTTLTSLGSHGWSGNASVRTNAYFYDASNGASIDYSAGSGRQLLTIVEAMEISRLQFKFQGGNYDQLIKNTCSTGGTTYTFRGNILWQAFNNGRGCYLLRPDDSSNGAALFIDNNLFVSVGAQDTPVGVGNFTTSKIYYNTFCYTQANGSVIAPAVSNDGYASLMDFRNNLFLNNITPYVEGAHGTTNSGDHNASTTSSTHAGWTNNHTNISITGELNGGTSYNDFSIKSTGAAYQGGITISGYTLDATGVTRKGAPDCGAWEVGAGASFVWRKLINDHQPVMNPIEVVAV